MTNSKFSARISRDTRDQVERHLQAHGLTKRHFVEQAFLHHLQSGKELPELVRDVEHK